MTLSEEEMESGKDCEIKRKGKITCPSKECILERKRLARRNVIESKKERPKWKTTVSTSGEGDRKLIDGRF